MRSAIASSAALLLTICGTALADQAKSCHLKTPAAVGCSSAEAAAIAYERLGFDKAATSRSNIRALLTQAQCVVAGDGYKTVQLQQFDAGRVPTATGWVDVKYLNVGNGKYALYYASRYVDGDCEPFKPQTCRSTVTGDKIERTCD